MVPAETAIGHPGLDERDRGIGDGVLLALLESRLGREPGLEQRRARDRRRPAVDLLEQPALVEDLEVAADGHVGHAELAHEVGDPDRAVLADPVEDECLALPSEHRSRVTGPAVRLCCHPPRPSDRRLPPNRQKVNVFQQ